MSDYSVEERIIQEGKYISLTGATVRQAAPLFGISKSAIHKDVTCKLKYLDKELYERVREVLKINFAEKHLRGGSATRKKYKKL